MKKFTSILCALMIVLSASAAPQHRVSKELKKSTSTRVHEPLKNAITLDGARKNVRELKFHKASNELQAVTLTKAGRAAMKAPQAKEDLSFDIQVTDISYHSALVTVVPSDDESTYYWDVFAAEDVAEATDEEIVSVVVAYLEEMVEYYASIGYDYTLPDFLSQGEDFYSFSGFDAGTKYVVVALPLDGEGNVTGAPTKKSFETEAIPDPTGETVNFGELECVMIDDYRDYDGSYVLYFGNEEETIEIGLNIYADDFGGEFTFEDLEPDYSYVWTEEGGVLEIQDATITAVLSEDGKSVAYTVSVIAINGVQYDFTSVADLWSLLDLFDPVDPTGGTFTITVADITSTGAAITVTPSVVNAYFYWTLVSPETIEGLSDEEIVKEVFVAEIEEYIEFYTAFGMDASFIDFLLHKEDSYTYSSLNPGTEYVVVAAYMDEEGNLRESVVKQSFTTLEAETADLSFEFTIGAAGITVTPSNNEDLWDYYIATEDLFAAYGADGIAEAIYEQYGTKYAVSGEYLFAWEGEEIPYYCSDEDTGETVPGTYYLVVWGAGESNVTTEAAAFGFEYPYNVEEPGGDEGVENVELTEKMQKVMVDGVVYIIRDNKLFNTLGTQIR